MVDLPKLLAASDRLHDEPDTFEDLKWLLVPGSSLGGARPKASVTDDGSLYIAKFPSKSDEWPVVDWEATTLDLAGRCGLSIPDYRLLNIAGRSVLLLKRFDRDHQGGRKHFLSAMSMLGASDNDLRCYLEIADALRVHGADPIADLKELFARISFSVLCSNTDDHLRNHGFIFVGSSGWRLSPAYDMNPTPTDVKPRVLSTEIEFGNAVASIDTLLNSAEFYGLSLGEAHVLIKRQADVITTWRKTALKYGITRAEQERMASAFEHDDLDIALSLT